jgi:hypothetical protein
MTYPTAAELREMAEATPIAQALYEFVWAFTEWYESVDEDGNGKVSLDTDRGRDMERAYERWLNLR